MTYNVFGGTLNLTISLRDGRETPRQKYTRGLIVYHSCIVELRHFAHPSPKFYRGKVR